MKNHSDDPAVAERGFTSRSNVTEDKSLQVCFPVMIADAPAGRRSALKFGHFAIKPYVQNHVSNFYRSKIFPTKVATKFSTKERGAQTCGL
jgi:hypothetical protein